MSIENYRGTRLSTLRAALVAAVAAAVVAISSGCTTIPLPTPVAPPPAAAAFAHGASPGGNGAAARAAPAPAAAANPSHRPFAEVVKDATEDQGFLTLWRKDRKVWIEILPEQFEQPMFLSNSLASGLGQQRFLPGLTGQEHMVVLRQLGDIVQLLARNLRVRAPEGTALQRAVQESYSDSLLAAAAVVSAPHPQRKSVLVDASALLGGDIAGTLTALEAAYHLPYAHDRTNSTIEHARANAEGISISMKMHFWIPKLPVIKSESASESSPRPPRVVPDARSFFLTYTYSLMPLPAKPMHPRRADERVGHFTDAFVDLGNELGLDKRTHYVNRWRLEKKDPTATLSEPKEPIRVIMDRNIPEKYRAAVRAGVLEWNRAFERIGFKSALVVQQQGEDAESASTDHGRHIGLRWFVMDGAGAMAVGPSQSDPRSGEILRAAVIIPENWVRIGRTSVTETLPKPTALSEHTHDNARLCTYAHDALDQLSFGLELLTERGLMDPHGPEADKFIFDSLREVTMHEMGHALGLRHNFKASTVLSPAQLRNADFVREHGISASLMDYIPLNLPLESEAASVYNMTTLGEYDYWAIEYAYTPFTADVEPAELAKIAARQSGNPALAYATDEDVAGAIDPSVNTFDLGNNPLAWYQRRLALSRELWTRTQARELKDGESYALYRRNVQRGLNQFSHVATLAVKYIGGVSTSREVPGATQASRSRALLVPVPSAQQREALQLLVREYFAPESFRFDPNFMQRLGVDQLDRLAGDSPQYNTDFSLATKVLDIQRSVLDPLMSDTTAQRLADAESKVSAAARRNLLSYADVQTALREAVWSELAGGKKQSSDIESMRRNLQREHLRRVATALVRPTSATATDVRAVHRQTALRLEADLRRAIATGKGNATTRAHLAESLATLVEALKASLVKGAV